MLQRRHHIHLWSKIYAILQPSEQHEQFVNFNCWIESLGNVIYDKDFCRNWLHILIKKVKIASENKIK